MEMVADARDQAMATLGMPTSVAPAVPDAPASAPPAGAGPGAPAAPPAAAGQAARTPRPHPSAWDRFRKDVGRRWGALIHGLGDFVDDFGVLDGIVAGLALVAGIYVYMTNVKFGFMSDYVSLFGGGLIGQGGLVFLRTLIPKILG